MTLPCSSDSGAVVFILEDAAPLDPASTLDHALDGSKQASHLHVLSRELDTGGHIIRDGVSDGIDVLAVALAVYQFRNLETQLLSVGTQRIAGFMGGIGIEALAAASSVLFEVVERPHFGIGQRAGEGSDRRLSIREIDSFE